MWCVITTTWVAAFKCTVIILAVLRLIPKRSSLSITGWRHVQLWTVYSFTKNGIILNYSKYKCCWPLTCIFPSFLENGNITYKTRTTFWKHNQYIWVKCNVRILFHKSHKGISVTPRGRCVAENAVSCNRYLSCLLILWNTS